MRAFLALVLSIASLLAGCTGGGGEESASCDNGEQAAVATLPTSGADEATVRAVLEERGWTMMPEGDALATFELPEGSTVRASRAGDDALRFVTPAQPEDDVQAAQILAPAVEPVVAGLSERTGAQLEAAYEPGCA